LDNNLTFIIIPSCGIGHYIDQFGNEIISQDLLTPTDTKIRCDVGAELFLSRESKSPKTMIITGGGIFLPKERQTKPAAYLMKEYLISTYNIDKSVIWCEDQSLDSWQNIQMMAKLFTEYGVDSKLIQLVIVSHWTHVLRLMYLALKCGFKFRNIRGKFIFYPIGWKETIKQLSILGFTVIDPKGVSRKVVEERKKRNQN